MAGPLFRQIANDLRRRIESGELGEGVRVPTEDQLMETYHASRNTVRGALKELATRGLVYTLHGKGSFVSARVNPIVIILTRDQNRHLEGQQVAVGDSSPTWDEPRVEIKKASSAVADALQIPEGTSVVIRHQRRYVDGLPWSLQTTYYPRSLSRRAPRLLDAGFVEGGTVAYMAECGIQQAGYQDKILWRGPDEEETAFFDLPVDGHVQVAEIRRVAFDQDENRVRLTITVCRADQSQFVINVGAVPASQMYGDDG